MSTKIYVFDEVGDRYEVHDIASMLNELLDEDLEMIYKSTRYYNELHLALAELIELGLMKQVEGEEYDSVGVQKGLTALSEEAVKRFDQETVTKWDEETDLQWKENKPDFSKYKK